MHARGASVKILMLALLLVCSSCMRNDPENMTAEEADQLLTTEWVYATALDQLKYNGEVITRPPGFEQLVMSLVIPTKGGLSSNRHCVYYQVPYKEKQGVLIVEVVKNAEACGETSGENKNFLKLTGIDKLKVTFQNFKLNLDFSYNKKSYTMSTPLANIESGLIHEKYQGLKEKRLVSGLRLLRLSDESFDFGSNKYLGKLSDRFSRGNAIRCEQVNKDCETIGENRCDQCRYGWYEVVDFQCPQGGSKFCGQNHCGEKNEPACPRGIKVIDPEEAGICQSDLEPKPNLDKILICQ